MQNNSVDISNGVNSRILIFSIAYEPLVGGAELAVRNLTGRLLQYEFDLITCRFSRKHPEQERIGNVCVYRVGFGSRLGRYLYPVLAFRLAKKLHQKEPYQIVWSIMAAYAGAAALMFLRRFPKLKFLLTLQEGDPIEHIHKQVRGFRSRWQQIFRRADYLTAISKYLADWARKEGARCPVEVVSNGVNPHSFFPSRREGGEERGGRVIITASRLVPKNGIDTLIRAAAELKAVIGDPKYVIQILGTGPDEEKLKKLARELEVEDVVVFLGNIEPDKVPQYLAQADIFVRPSRSEGLGSSFLEAMAAGLSVIGTPVGGIPEFLKDQETGLFCKIDDPKDLASKIRQLLEDEKLRIKLGENGRRLMEDRYSWDAIAKQMGQIFQKLKA